MSEEQKWPKGMQPPRRKVEEAPKEPVWPASMRPQKPASLTEAQALQAKPLEIKTTSPAPADQSVVTAKKVDLNSGPIDWLPKILAFLLLLPVLYFYFLPLCLTVLDSCVAILSWLLGQSNDNPFFDAF